MSLKMQSDQNNKRKLKDWWVTRYCSVCVEPLGKILSRGRICQVCGFRVCNKCSRTNQRDQRNPGSWICYLCNGENSNGSFSSNSLKHHSLKPIKRSLTISNPSSHSQTLFLSRSNSPVLKSYTVLHPEESQRHYYSLPRLNTCQKMSEQLEDLYSTRNVNNHNYHYSTLHPFTTQNKVPSVFIEETFWDYYDMPQSKTPSRSNRSSCERSLGETVDYQYSLKLSYSNTDLSQIDRPTPIKPERKNRSKSLNSYDLKFSPLRTYCVLKKENKENIHDQQQSKQPADEKVLELMRKSGQLLAPRKKSGDSNSTCTTINSGSKSDIAFKSIRNNSFTSPSTVTPAKEQRDSISAPNKSNLKESPIKISPAPNPERFPREKREDAAELERRMLLKLEKPLLKPLSLSLPRNQLSRERDRGQNNSRHTKYLSSYEDDFPLKNKERIPDSNLHVSRLKRSPDDEGFQLGQYSSLPTKAKLRKWNISSDTAPPPPPPSPAALATKDDLRISSTLPRKFESNLTKSKVEKKYGPVFYKSESDSESERRRRIRKWLELPQDGEEEGDAEMPISHQFGNGTNGTNKLNRSELNGMNSFDNTDRADRINKSVIGGGGERLIKIEMEESQRSGCDDSTEHGALRQHPIITTSTKKMGDNVVCNNNKSSRLDSVILDRDKKSICITNNDKKRALWAAPAVSDPVPSPNTEFVRLLNNKKCSSLGSPDPLTGEMTQKPEKGQSPNLDNLYLDLDGVPGSSSSSSGSSSYLSNEHELSYELFHEAEQCEAVSEEDEGFEYKCYNGQGAVVGSRVEEGGRSPGGERVENGFGEEEREWPRNKNKTEENPSKGFSSPLDHTNKAILGSDPAALQKQTEGEEESEEVKAPSKTLKLSELILSQYAQDKNKVLGCENHLLIRSNPPECVHLNDDDPMSKFSSSIFISSPQPPSTVSPNISATTIEESGQNKRNVTTVEINGSSQVDHSKKPKSAFPHEEEEEEEEAIQEKYNETPPILPKSAPPSYAPKIVKVDQERKSTAAAEGELNTSGLKNSKNEVDGALSTLAPISDQCSVNTSDMTLLKSPTSQMQFPGSRSSPEGQEQESSEGCDPFKSHTRSSPDGADRSEEDEDEPSSTPTRAELEALDLTSEEDDSWVEDNIFKECKPPLDLTLHTIVEESESEHPNCEDDDLLQDKHKGSKSGGKRKKNSTSELEKYFNFYPGISYANEDSEFSDTFSESSFCTSSELVGEESSTNVVEGVDDPVDLASTRLEKYFMGLGVQIQDSDVAAASESESDVSLRKKKKIKKHHRRSAEFNSDEFAISDEDEEHETFGKEGLDTIKKTRRRKSSENLLESSKEKETPPIALLSGDSSMEKSSGDFRIWSSDEEVNMMMSKLRSLIKSIAKPPLSSASAESSTYKDSQIQYLENELIRLMKSEDLRIISSEAESEEDYYAKIVQKIQRSTENSPNNSPALLAKVMSHIGNRLSEWMSEEKNESGSGPGPGPNAHLSPLKMAQSVSSDLNEDRFSWKGSFESTLAVKRQSVGSQDSLSSSDFTSQDRSILRSSSLHHLAANQQSNIKKNEEERITNSLPRLNQESQPMPRAQSLALVDGPIKSARYRPPGFQNRKESSSTQSTPVLNQTPEPQIRSDSFTNLYDQVESKPQIRGRVEFGIMYNYKSSSMEVRVKQCRDLAAIDPKRNRADPYVKVYLLPDRTKGGKRKTKTKKNTLNPIFDETLKFPLSLFEVQNRTLWLSVWHNDIFGKNEFLGEVLINLKDRVFDDPNLNWFELGEMSVQQDEAAKGDIVLALKFQKLDQNDELGTLSVLVKEAKNLTPKNGLPSTFVKCTLLKDKRKQKTSICRRTFNPIWNQTLTFEDTSDESGIELSIWNHDLLNSDHIGTVRLDEHHEFMRKMMTRTGFWVESLLPIM